MLPGNCDNETVMKIRHLFTIRPGSARFPSRGVKYSLGLFVVTCWSACALGAGTAPLTVSGLEVHPRRILAQFRDASQVAANAGFLQQLGLSVYRQYGLVPGLVALDDLNPAEAATNSAEVLQGRLLSRLEALRQSGQFEFVEPDYIAHVTAAPTDQAFVNGTLWGLRNYGQSGGKAGADISATNAWDLTKGSTNVIVAVVDTGIRYTHRDLKAQMWKNAGEIAGNDLDDDGNGFVDDIYGINAITGTGDPFDDHDHGTHVSGTIGASANDGGTVGVTWRVRLMGCKAFDADGFGSTSDEITCINYAVSKSARIMNASWGGRGYSQALFNAINAARAKGVLFVAAAGNSGTDNDGTPFYPANYALDNIISVAAMDRSDNLASFSCYGANTVHLGAPGVSIYSSTAGSDTSYDTMDGTSMAAPHVSGVAALILGLYPSADYTEVRQRILLGAVPIPALNGMTTTGGRLNAYQALTLVGTGQLQADVDPPSGSVLLSSSAQPVYVKVSDTFGVYNATVTASIAGLTNLVFTNNGRFPDVVSNDNVYSSVFQVPTATNPLTMTVVATAPGKGGTTNVVNYWVAPPPPNDYFTNALKVPVAGAVYLSNNKFATLEPPNEPPHNGSEDAAASLWWVWTPTSNTNMFIDLTGSKIDTVLAVYTGSALGSLTAVVSTNSDLAQHRPACVGFSAQAGRGYRIAVAAASTNSLGSIQLRLAPGGQFDTTPPEVFVNSPMSGLTVFDRSLNITGTALDPAPNASGVMEVLVAVNGGIASSAVGTSDWLAPALLSPGQNWIQVRSLDEAGNFSSPVTIQINYVVPPPTNDFFVNALSLTSTQGVTTGFSTNATKEVGEPYHVGNQGGKSLWWSFQPPEDGLLTLSTSNSTFDTLLAIYTGATVSTLTLIGDNDDTYSSAPGGFSQMIQAVRANQTYHIAVDGYDGVSGRVSLSHSFAPARLCRLTVNAASGGVATPSSMDVASNSTIVVSASPSQGFSFDRWTGSVASFANPLSVVVKSNLSLTANFIPVVYSDGFEGYTNGFSTPGLRLPWTTSSLAWLVQTTNVSTGQSAARSASIGNGQSSSLFLSTNFMAGIGSFDLRVSSEAGWDFLRFFVDGVLVQEWSGEVPWSGFEIPLSAGAHTLEWRYVKDATDSAGWDAAFLDSVRLPVAVPIDASAPAHLTVSAPVDGNCIIELTGQVNQTYVLQSSQDLIAWQNIGTNVAVGGFTRFLDPFAKTNAPRFYRAYVPAQP